MTDSDLEKKITWLLTEKLSIQVSGPDTDLIAMGALDSLALVDLLVQIEENIGVAISIEELDLTDLRSVRSIGALLSKRLAPR